MGRESARTAAANARFVGSERLAYEIIAVDRASTDGTPAIAEGLPAGPVREQRRGYAVALETGFVELVVTTC